MNINVVCKNCNKQYIVSVYNDSFRRLQTCSAQCERVYFTKNKVGFVPEGFTISRLTGRVLKI